MTFCEIPVPLKSPPAVNPPPPPPVICASAGAAAESVALKSCESPAIVAVKEKHCGPVPSGGTTPGEMHTVKVHCVSAGVMLAFGYKFRVKLPVESSDTGPTVP